MLLLWGGTALEGLEQLESMGRFVSGGLEIVVGDFVSLNNASTIIAGLKPEVEHFCLHTYSAVLEHGNVSSLKVGKMKSLMVPI